MNPAQPVMNAFIPTVVMPSPPQHDHQEVIAHASQQRPARRVPVHTPESLIEARVLFPDGSQVRRWRQYTNPTIVFQREVGRESAIELAWRVITGPHGSLVHANGLHVLGEADPRSFPVALQGV